MLVLSIVHLFILVTDYTLKKFMSAYEKGIIAMTGRAHCQRQVAFLKSRGDSKIKT